MAMRNRALAIVALLTAGAAQAGPIQPGLWEITSKVETINMPSAPPAVAQAMRGRPTTVRNCVTPEQAAQGPREMMKADKSCSFTRYNLTGGVFDSEVVCKRPTGTMTASSTGRYTPTSFAARSRMNGTGKMAMTMTASMTGKRIGPCK
jgi:hypothetical protein